MDRTAEFKALLHTTPQQAAQRDPKFYEQIYDSIEDISSRIKSANTYRQVLAIEKEMDEMMKRTTELFGKISVLEDLQQHFEGVKQVINKKIVDVSKQITIAKRRVSNLQVELEPQKPRTFKKTEENQVFEQENRTILESTQYEATKQKLMKIESVQKAIQENLMLQDERIDSICTTQSEAGEIYKSINQDSVFSKGSFTRRSISTIIYCLSFTLAFVHIFYRK